MAITSGLSIDLVGDLSDIPLGQNGGITRLSNGGYAVIAEAAGLGVSVLRIFDAEGNAVRSIGFEGTAPVITGLADGGIAVATNTPEGNLAVQVVASDLETVTDGAGQDGAGIAIYPTQSIAATPDGGFVVAVTEFLTDPLVNNDLLLLFRDANGNAGLPIFIEDSDTAEDADIAVLANGDVVVVRTEDTGGGTDIVFSSYDSLGNEVIPRTVIPNIGAPGDDRHARVVATADGFAIVYETRFLPGLELDIRLRTFDLNGEETDNQLITNSTFSSTGNDDGVDDTAPEIAIAPDGNIAITWTRDNDGNADPMLFVLGLGSEQTLGVDTFDNPQSQPLVTFFGTGQLATYHFDGKQNALVGEHHSGFRDSFGTNRRDIFAGDDFQDLINGLGGNDRLSGANGDDTVQGGDGRDKLFGNDGDDLLQGEEGIGANGGGDHSDRMFGGAGNDTLEGENGDDTLDGGTGNDLLDGGLDNDLLLGQSQSDTLKGNIGTDRLFGGNGDDTLDGGLGVDEVTGGLGADRFLLSVATAGNRDAISDFASGEDKIALDFQVFFVIGSQVDASQLRFGTAAQDADDFLIYDQPTGRLFFDADANGAGNAVLIATIPAGSALVFTDFVFA